MAHGEDDIERIGRETFGWEELHPGIARAAAAAASGRDVLAVMPTGYGKSGVYELAGVVLGGVIVVVSPLIALQADQLAHFEDAGLASVALNSAQGVRATRQAWRTVEEAARQRRPVFVLLSPEQLADDRITERLRAGRVALLAVDEAQCVSLWGDDFRPDYGALRERAEAMGRPPVVALTATGSPPVRADIVERLGLAEPLVVARGFDRPNLRIEVRRHETDAEKHAAVLEQLAALEGPGLLYVSTRRAAERYAEELRARGIRATGYHGALPAGRRRAAHEAFSAGELDVVAATSAFGMGIDKSDVRFVVHAEVPGSPDLYYQEIGRAGRDGAAALACLHYRPEDFALSRFFNGGLPDPERLAALLGAIAGEDGGEAAGGTSRAALARALGASPRSLERGLRLLEESHVVESHARGYRLVRRGPENGVEAAIETARRRQRIDASRLEMMRAFAETLGCRRQALLGYFGEELAEPCGNCDSCTSGSAYEHASAEGEWTDAGAPVRLHDDVVHERWGAGVVMRVEADRVTVYFEEEGYKVLALEAVGPGGALRVTSPARRLHRTFS